jgi:pimeloyl-ACP methyl ester carboxylesterase
MSQVLVTRHPERIGALVLTNCDTHENFPPGVFKAMPPLAKLPGAMAAMGLPMRVGALRRAAFKPFARHPIPPELIDSWIEPGQSDSLIRRDTAKLAAGMNKRYTLEAAERLRSFEHPVLLAWAPGDRFFKLAYAERLAKAIPDATLKTIDDAGTFVALDQPERLAELIDEFVGAAA